MTLLPLLSAVCACPCQLLVDTPADETSYLFTLENRAAASQQAAELLTPEGI
jgi:hypothetical protein